MKRWFKALTLGITIGTIGGLLGLSTYGTIFERKIGLTWLFHVRGEVSPPPQAVIIAIDGFTGEKLGFSNLIREWPRSIHGQLIDALKQKGAEAIIFDIDFHRPRSEKDEKVFADSAHNAQNVVLFQRLTGKQKPITDSNGKIQGTVWVERLLSPVPVLSQAVRGLGPFPLPKDEAAVYQFWAFKSSARESPTIPAVALQVYALKIYPLFLRLLENSGINTFLSLPSKAANIRDAKQLRDLMIAIRNTMTDNPSFVQRLLQEAQQNWVIEQDIDTRKLLYGLINMYIGDNDRYLNFYGSAATIKTVPYHAVIKGSDPNVVPADLDFTNKVVFVGLSDPYDPGQPDRFYTVFTNKNGVDLSGVEIAATAFGNLLHNQSIQVPDPVTTFFIIFSFGLLFSLLIYMAPAIFSIPVSILLIGLYVYISQTVFNQHFIWLPLATPVLVQFPVALFIGLMIQYLQQRHQVKHISEAISFYVPEEVSKALTDNSPSPNSINQTTFSTCLATDMAGFSTLSEKMDPGELAEFLNDYFDSLAKPLRHHGVNVTEFRADAIMCAWTGSENEQSTRENPILASLDAAIAIEEFKARHDVFNASLRIGMECGTVYVGHSGGGGHYVYSIVGDSANTASRIEGLNKHMDTQILTTKPVTEDIDNLLLRPLGEFVFVGKTEPLPVVEILATQTDASSQQKERCERFAAGYELFLKAQWQQASDVFRKILGDFPHDGPSKFYFSQCQQRISNSTLSENPFIIHMTQK